MDFSPKIRLRNKTGNRALRFHTLLYKLVSIVDTRNLRSVIENPYTSTYLKYNFLRPQVIDMNRMKRGDFFRKPTAYWFFNCEPTYGLSQQQDKEVLTACGKNGESRVGLCSEERSMISPDYARNRICDFVLGKDPHLEPSLFDQGISGDLAYD